MKKIVSLVLMAVMSITMFVGCGTSYATLEDFYNNYPGAKETWDASAQQSSSADMTTSLTVSGNTMNMIFTLSDSMSSSFAMVDEATITSTFDNAFSSFDSTFEETFAKPAFEVIKAEEVGMHIEIVDNANKVYYTKDFTATK